MLERETTPGPDSGMTVTTARSVLPQELATMAAIGSTAKSGRHRKMSLEDKPFAWASVRECPSEHVSVGASPPVVCNRHLRWN